MNKTADEGAHNTHVDAHLRDFLDRDGLPKEYDKEAKPDNGEECARCLARKPLTYTCQRCGESYVDAAFHRCLGHPNVTEAARRAHEKMKAGIDVVLDERLECAMLVIAEAQNYVTIEPGAATDVVRVFAQLVAKKILARGAL